MAVEINPNLCAAAEENFKLNNITNAHVLVCDSAKFANQVLRTKKYALYVPTAAESQESPADLAKEESAPEPANLSTRSKKKHAAALRHAQRSSQNKSTTGAARNQQPRVDAGGKNDDVVNTEGLFEDNECALLAEVNVVTSAVEACSLPAADTPAPMSTTQEILSVPPSVPAAPQHVPLYVFKFGAVLVDPPRCGLDKQTLSLVAGYAHILYISCSPESLMRDLKAVSDIFIFFIGSACWFSLLCLDDIFLNIFDSV